MLSKNTIPVYHKQMQNEPETIQMVKIREALAQRIEKNSQIYIPPSNYSAKQFVTSSEIDMHKQHDSNFPVGSVIFMLLGIAFNIGATMLSCVIKPTR